MALPETERICKTLNDKAVTPATRWVVAMVAVGIYSAQGLECA
jgi:hypothetical protein